METRQMVDLTLAAGERRRYLLEAGSMLLVLGGQLELRGPLQWLSENVVADRQVLDVEQMHTIEREAWFDLNANGAVRVVIIPPQDISVWTRVGDCLGRIFGKSAARGVPTI